MKDPRYRIWPDGTRVRLNAKAVRAMATGLRAPAAGVDAVYTIRNTATATHDVILEETGDRYGYAWLRRLPQTAAVDVDGTLALLRNPDGSMNREPYAYRLVSFDRPNPPVVSLVQTLHDAGHAIVFCSGRPERGKHGYDVRAATSEWLAEQLGDWVRDAPLLMRGADDGRPDAVVKRELYERFIAPDFDVRLVLDDRDSVVRMWRSLGLTCLQVAPGDF